MKKLKHIYENDLGITCFDKYFEYLNSIKMEMPVQLASFATDIQRYELSGEHTLHDAWLKSLSITKNYGGGLIQTSSVQMRLLLGTHRKTVSLTYSDVTAVSYSLTPDRWIHQPVDLLVHEFSMIAKGKYQHTIEFDRAVWFDVVFSSFEFDECPVPPSPKGNEGQIPIKNASPPGLSI